MVLQPDGRVDGSGIVVWSDGTRRGFGHGEDRSAGQVRSVRDVDACSGVALAVRRSVFSSLGGFDDRYGPAGYEDIDLCFGVRSLGLRVVVEPASVVRHLAAAPDAVVGLSRFQEVNRLAFVRKWRDDLSGHLAPDLADVWAAANRTRTGTVLVVEPVLPTPDRDAGSRRMWAILEELAALNMSIYYAVGEHIAIQPYRRELERRGVTVLETAAEQLRFLEDAGTQLRAVMLCRPGVAWSYLDDVYRLAPQATLIFDTVDLHGLRMHRQSDVEQDLSLAHHGRLVWIKERAAMQAVDVTLVVSGVEKQIIENLVPDVDVRVLSTIHSPVITAPQLEGRKDIVFVGGYLHPPNVDAARWAVRDIMPVVWQTAPDATLRLLGSYLPTELSELDGHGIDARGWVPDLAPYYESARVVIAPIRFGAGVKGKVGEAIEYGVPVVGTSIALEGMELVHGLDVLCADEPADFADAVVRLLTDDVLWRAMAGHGQAVLAEQFSPQRARDTLRDILNEPRRQRPVSDFAGFSVGSVHVDRS